MKTAGLIGGIGPESTIEYYRFLIDGWRARAGEGRDPSILINSVDLPRLIGMMQKGDHAGVVEYLAPEIERLARGGAAFAALASNTPHIVFDDLRRRSSIPMISIVEAARDAAIDLGLKRLGLFGTRFTMQATFYPEVFAARGLSVAVPDPDDQAYIHDKYMSELLKGLILPETRDGLIAIARRLRERHGVEGIILGGTELPLILRDAPGVGVPWLDTTRIHVDRILAAMLA